MLPECQGVVYFIYLLLHLKILESPAPKSQILSVGEESTLPLVWTWFGLFCEGVLEPKYHKTSTLHCVTLWKPSQSRMQSYLGAPTRGRPDGVTVMASVLVLDSLPLSAVLP